MTSEVSEGHIRSQLLFKDPIFLGYGFCLKSNFIKTLHECEYWKTQIFQKVK